VTIDSENCNKISSYMICFNLIFLRMTKNKIYFIRIVKIIQNKIYYKFVFNKLINGCDSENAMVEHSRIY